MKNKNELSYKDLKMTCNPNLFKFETTEELDPIQEGIGQDRGIKALEFGLQVDVKGYNLYLEGPSGVGKTMYTKNYLDKNKIPYDKIMIDTWEKAKACQEEKIELFIDDAKKHCEEVSKLGIDVLMMETNYNKEYKEFKHVKNWHEVYEYIKNRRK